MSKHRIPEVHSSEPSEADIEILKKLYLPESKINFQPGMESIERANGLNPSKYELKDSDVKAFKNLYLPHSKDNYQPSDETIDRANNLNSDKPNTLI